MPQDSASQIAILAVAGAMVAVVLSIAVLFFFIIYQKKKVELNLAQTRHQQEILKTQIEIQQQSFQNISQEIHDNIGQVLSLVKLNLARVSGQTEGQQCHQTISETLVLTAQAITDLRNLSKGLNPDFVQQMGLAGCIGFEMERLKNTGMFMTDFIQNGRPFSLPLSKEFVVYRVVQECLNNIIKHAGATTITASIVYSSEQVILRIADNGRGFDVSGRRLHSDSVPGSGLGNMQQRMELIGGNLQIESSEGSGTAIQLTVPST